MHPNQEIISIILIIKCTANDFTIEMLGFKT